jgi:hypothetical protein
MKIPTLQELISETPESLKQNALMLLLNQDPPANWLQQHPMINNYKYLPIERIEWLLTRIFGRWWVEVREVQTVANSVVVTVRLFVINPLTGDTEFQDGIGAAPIQTDKGAGAADWNAVKTDGVQKAAPAAESYAISDAADKFGKIFGKDVNRKQKLDYNELALEGNKPEPQKIVLDQNYKGWAKALEASKDGTIPAKEQMLLTYHIPESALKILYPNA